MFARGIIVLLCVLVAISVGVRPRVPQCARYPPDICPEILKPVCATNGVTYEDECMLCAAMRNLSIGFLIKKDGRC